MGTHNLCFGAKIRKIDIPLHTPVLLYESGVQGGILFMDMFSRCCVFRNNDYSKQGDLQLDMPPAIGSVNVKEIMIEKNDNAEGTIEFLPEAMQFTGKN